MLLKLPTQFKAMAIWGLLALIALVIMFICRKFYSDRFSKYNDMDFFCYIYGLLLLLRGLFRQAIIAFVVGILLILLPYILRRRKNKVSEEVKWGLIAILFLIIGLLFKDITFIGEGLFFLFISGLTYKKGNVDLKKTIVVFSLITICLGCVGYYGSNKRINNNPVMAAGTSMTSLKSASKGDTLKLKKGDTSIMVFTKKGSKITTYYNDKKNKTYTSSYYDYLNLNKLGSWKIVDKIGNKSVTMPVYVSAKKPKKVRKNNHKKNNTKAKLELEGLNDKGEYQVQEDDKNEWGEIRVSGTTEPNAKVLISYGTEPDSDCKADSTGHFSCNFGLSSNEVDGSEQLSVKTVTADKKKKNKKSVKVVDPDGFNEDLKNEEDDDDDEDSSFATDDDSDEYSDDSSYDSSYSSHSSKHISKDDKLWLITTAKEYLKHDYENVKMPWGISDYTYSKEPGDTYIMSGEFKSNGQIHDFEMLIYMDDDKTEVLTANVE